MSDLLHKRDLPVTSWELPAVGAESGQSLKEEDIAACSEDVELNEVPVMPTAQEIENWEKESREAGLKKGYEEGWAQATHKANQRAEAELNEQKAQLSALIEAMARPLSDLDEDAEQQLLKLVVVLAQQLVRRELRAEPGEIIPVIREAVALLPASAQNIRVRLNPDDASLVRELLPGSEGQWALIEDPLISRGGCRVETDLSRVEATLESRLAAVATSVLGGERGTD